jgi:hypothetical protein
LPQSFASLVLDTVVAIFIAIVLTWALGPVIYQLNPGFGVLFYAVMVIVIFGLGFAVVEGIRRRL